MSSDAVLRFESCEGVLRDNEDEELVRIVDAVELSVYRSLSSVRI